MKFKIYFNKGEHQDYFIVEGNTIEEIKTKVLKESEFKKFKGILTLEIE